MAMPLVAQRDNHSIYWELMVYSSRLLKRSIQNSVINNRLLHFCSGGVWMRGVKSLLWVAAVALLGLNGGF